MKTYFHKLFESQKTLCLVPEPCDYCDYGSPEYSAQYGDGGGGYTYTPPTTTSPTTPTTTTSPTTTTTTTTTTPTTTTTTPDNTQQQQPATVSGLVGQLLQSGSALGGGLGGLLQNPLYLFAPQPNVTNPGGGAINAKSIIVLGGLGVAAFFLYRRFAK